MLRNVFNILREENHYLENQVSFFFLFNLFSRGKNFWKSFGQLDTLSVYYREAPIIALSGTLTVEQKSFPRLLHRWEPYIVEENPDHDTYFSESV